MKRIALLSCALALAVVVACGGEAREPGEASGDLPSDSVAAGSDGDAEQVENDPAIRIARLGDFRTAGVTSPTGFDHEPHREIACVACHPDPAGHSTHGMVECGECHDPPSGLRATVLPSPGECMACHHEPTRGRACTSCHDGAASLPAVDVRVTIDVAGRSDDRVRSLRFRHDLHAAPDCTDCHSAGGGFAATGDCAACHENHHRPEADCLSCHAPLPLDTHDRAVHDGCAGAACHTDPTVIDMPATRSVCLSCHQDLTDHEPGRDCATCHQLGGGP